MVNKHQVLEFNQMLSLMYVSRASKKYCEDELEVMLTSFCHNNEALGITGVLLYNGAGTFIQVIEGEEKDLEPLYNKIVNDPRHDRVNCLRKVSITTRQFPDWRMGYRNLTKDAIKENPTFLDFLSDQALEKFIKKDTDLAFSVLTHFKNITKELIF